MKSIFTRLRLNQWVLLRELPPSPSDGIRCKGGPLRTAGTLCRRGFARMVGAGQSGGYFVRTPEGTAALREHAERARR